MKKYLIFTVISVVTLLMTDCKKGKMKTFIIPQPVKVVNSSGAFILSDPVKIFISPSDSGLKRNAEFLAEKIKIFSGYDVNIIKSPVDTEKGIHLKFDKNILFREGYHLKIDSQNINISGQTAAGIFYGIQSLLQLFPQVLHNSEKGNKLCAISCVEITDYPRFSWRGMHLDVCRHFFEVDFINKYIDFLASYKMNVFHWHLTDDQGWRIEIKKYPKLTEVGAWRIEEDGKKYGGFYTQEQIKEIIKYAADRYITVLPEVEMPGHATALLYAYPELACTDSGPKTIPNSWGIFYDVMNPGKEETFAFIDDVLTEVSRLFPCPYIHIGGDECPKEQWKKSILCQETIRKNKLKDELELQGYFIKRVEKILVSKGKKLIGWDEILEGGLAPEATVMSWRGNKGGIESANQEHDVVMAPSNFVYLNNIQGDAEYEPLGHTPANTLEKVYYYDPVPEQLPPENRKYILGGEGCLWTEYIPSPDIAEYMLFPRLMALAEVYWSPSDKKDYDSFLKRMIYNFSNLKVQDINFRIPKPTGLKLKNIILEKPGNFNPENPLKSSGAIIRYTTDGSEPRLNSVIYKIPLKIYDNKILKTKLYLNDQYSSETLIAFFYKPDTSKNGLYCNIYENAEIPVPAEAKPFQILKVYDIDPHIPYKTDKVVVAKYIARLRVQTINEMTFYLKADASVRLYFNSSLMVKKEVQPGVKTYSEFKFHPQNNFIDIIIEYKISEGGEMLELGTISKSGNREPLSPSAFVK